MAGSRTHWFADEGLTADTDQLSGENLNRARALRIRIGEQVVVTNGFGSVASCVVTDESKAELRLQQTDWQRLPKPPSRRVIQAITKHDPVESALRLAAEFGATSFIPWQAERSVPRWDGAQAEKQHKRLRAIATDQALLNHLAWFPSVENLASKLPKPEGNGFILTPDADLGLRELLRTLGEPSTVASAPITLIVGPEGGLSEGEIQHARALGYLPASLGAVSYRSASAGAAALALLGSWALSS